MINIRFPLALPLALALTMPMGAAVISVSAPTGTSGTDIASINTAIAASSSGDTVRFAAGTYNTNGTTITLNSDHRTYDCVTAGTCIISNPNTSMPVFGVTSTRNTMTVTKLVMTGCGIDLGANGTTLFVNPTITFNAFQTCEVSSGQFINVDQFSGISGGTISHNTFTDGGSCYANDGSCDGPFSGIRMWLMPNTTIDSNTMTHVDRGISQYYQSVDINGGVAQPGIRITNNTFTRLHTRAIEVQGLNETGEVISGNYAHKWQDAFYGSWGFSMAQGFGYSGAGPEAQNTLIQNNVFDARDSVLDDLVTLHTDTTLCMEVSGVNTTVDSNQCLALTTAQSGSAAYFTGWDQGIYSGMFNGTISNTCFGGLFESNQTPFTNPNYFTYGDGGTSTTTNLPTVTGTLAYANANSCPTVLGSSPTITTSSFPAGVTGSAYNFTAMVTGGTGPYTWSITTGALPTGLTLTASTGGIAGTPTGSGASSFTIKVTDNNAATASLATSITINASAGVTSDNFTGSSLNGSLWTLVNPVGDGSESVSGGELHLVVPGAALHDPAFGSADNSVRVTQPISGNFTAIAKFDSIPSMVYQFEGIVADQDSSNWMYIQTGWNGSAVEVDINTQLAGTTTTLASATITPGASIWLSLSQSGTAWTASYSVDGVNFTTLLAFTQSFTTVDTGPFGGNYNSSTPASPAFTALVDSFLNGTSAPDMTITMTHSGNFAQSQVGATYTVTATNSGSTSTSGTVTVSSSLPAGLTATALSGSAWACTLSTLTCTRSDALSASASYPALTLTVNVAANAGTPLVPSSTVAGGGETNTSNDTATNSTTVTTVVTMHNVVFTGLGVPSAGVYPIMTITDTSNTVLGTYTLTASSASYTYTTSTLPVTNIRVQFTNGISGGPSARTATVTNFTVDGNATLPTAATVFTLSHSPYCPTGFLKSTVIGCTGYMEFPLINAIAPIDTTAPSVPTGLAAVPIYSGAITLAWSASVDDVGVVGYRITRNGVSTGVTTPVPSYVDSSVVIGTTYTYGVLAVDAAGNASALSTTVMATASQSGTVWNGGLTVLGTGDFSRTGVSIPFSVVNNEPATGVTGQSLWNSGQSYLEIYRGAAGGYAVLAATVAKVAWTGASAALGGGGSSPVILCSAAACPAGTYNVIYRLWTTATQASSTVVLSVAYNDGTAARVQSSASLDQSALNFISGIIPIVADGVNPITYYTALVGASSYSGRITLTREQ